MEPTTCPVCASARIDAARYCHNCGHAYTAGTPNAPAVIVGHYAYLSVGSGVRFGVGLAIAWTVIGFVAAIVLPSLRYGIYF